MSADPEAPAVEPDTPTPEVSDPTPEIDYAKRYSDLRPEFDRTKQELAELRALLEDDEKFVGYIQEKKPYLLADEDDDEPYGDPAADSRPDQQVVTDPRVDEHHALLEQIQAEKAAEAFENDLKQAVGDRTLPKKGRDWIELQTYLNGNSPEALDQAVKDWFEDDELQPKRSRPTPPHVPPGGAPVEDPGTPKTHQDRVQRALDRMNAEQA